ncbi:MAG TPA: mannosyl-3-phosphoglycerate phosphatase, partial [Candidatus Krumholzibacteria bacterium]|nr:mannosyl-3-phosphoglycerate phosphatase [Candidatus Krumholzibacteria bacterium]
EDGSAIYIEHGYFAFDFPHERVNDTLGVIKLGPGYDTVRRALAEVRAETGIPLQGYGDIDADTVASITGLSPAAARLARQREFHETIVSRLTNREAAYVAAALASRGLRLTRGGRFFGAGGPGDKGTAVAALAKLFQRKLGPVELVGLGDSHNDVAMLTAVDVAALVQKSDGTWERVPTRGIRRVQGVGPAGWNDFVTHYLTHGAGQSVPRRRVRARADNVRG